ncbi:MAG: rhodanese-like domain-containing protein [Gammaproteobacteria bacterium]
MSLCLLVAVLLLFSTASSALPSELTDKKKVEVFGCTAQYNQDQDLIKDYGFTALSDAGDAQTHHCFVRVSDVFKDWKNNRITLVDVRNKAEYASHRIPGAVNIPLFAVKQKSFLRHRAVVLLNEGRTHVELLSTCKALMADGFDNVKVLDGGIHSWITMSGPVDGNKAALAHHRVITPPEFVSALPERQWVVILLDDQKKSTFVSLAGHKVIEYPGDMDQLVNVLVNAFKKNEQGDTRNAVLLANRQGKNYQAITALLKEHAVSHTFLLAGGTEAYQGYLSQHLAMRSKMLRGPEPVRRCGG